jgi:hypothetical protein
MSAYFSNCLTASDPLNTFFPWVSPLMVNNGFELAGEPQGRLISLESFILSSLRF